MKLLNATTPVKTEFDIIRDWSLITTKPILCIINMDKKSFIRKDNKWSPKINNSVKEHRAG